MLLTLSTIVKLDCLKRVLRERFRPFPLNWLETAVSSGTQASSTLRAATHPQKHVISFTSKWFAMCVEAYNHFKVIYNCDNCAIRMFRRVSKLVQQTRNALQFSHFKCWTNKIQRFILKIFSICEKHATEKI